MIKYGNSILIFMHCSSKLKVKNNLNVQTGNFLHDIYLKTNKHKYLIFKNTAHLLIRV